MASVSPPPPSDNPTREAWLQSLADFLRPHFDKAGFPLPDNFRASCGFPSKSALAAKNRRIGECWADSASDAEVFEVFITPLLDDPAEVGAILVHELTHVAVGLQCGHKGAFRRAALAVGLEGKMTATTAGEALRKRLHALIEEIGLYPHARLHASNRKKKQTTRMLKVECTECGCVVRMTAKWLTEIGPPTCACGADMRLAE